MTKEIVIKEVDNGGAAVIIDSVRCGQMVYKQRGDKNTYKKQWEQTMYLLRSVKSFFLEQEIDYLTNFQYESSNLYSLSQIH